MIKIIKDSGSKNKKESNTSAIIDMISKKKREYTLKIKASKLLLALSLAFWLIVSAMYKEIGSVIYFSLLSFLVNFIGFVGYHNIKSGIVRIFLFIKALVVVSFLIYVIISWKFYEDNDVAF